VFTAPILAAEPYCLHLVCLAPTAAPVIGVVGFDGNLPPATGMQAAQFALRYRYLADKISGLSPYTSVAEWAISRLYDNTTNDHEVNFVNLYLPPLQSAFVKEVELLVRLDDNATWALARTLNVAAGETWPIPFVFSGTITGAVVPLADTTKPFEALWPARSMGVAQNRLLAGGQGEGYVLPIVGLSVDSRESRRLLRNIEVFNVGFAFYEVLTGTGGDPAATYQRLIPRDPDGFYWPGWPPETNVSGLTSFGVQDVYDSGYYQTGLGIGRTFRSNSTYPVSLLYRDGLGRHAGATKPVLVNTGIGIDFDKIEMQWDLPDGISTEINAMIPPWAASYQILVGQNLETLSFQQGRIVDMLGYFGDNPDGSPILHDRNWINDRWNEDFWWEGPDFLPVKSVWLDIGEWYRLGAGYVFDPKSGDVLEFLGDEAAAIPGTYPILRQVGNYLEITLLFGPSSRAGSAFHTKISEIYPSPPWSDEVARATIEIRRGRTINADEPLLYEATPIYPVGRVTEDGEAYRYFTTVTGGLLGDCLSRSLSWWGIDYSQPYSPLGQRSVLQDASTTVTLSMSASRLSLWMDMARQRSTAHLATVLQFRARYNVVRFSDPRIQATATDGVSSWAALNEKEVPRELGPITGLRLVDDVSQSTGSVLAVICRDSGGSFYIGRAQLRDAGDTALNVEAEQVLGSFNTWRGTNGCQDPDSLASGNGFIFGVDRRQRVIWRIGQDGQTALSIELKCQAIVKALLDDSTRVVGVYDPIAREYWAVGDNGRAVLYSQRQGQFVGTVRTFAEAMIAGSTTLLSFYDGVPWLHSDFAPAASFGGLFTPPTVTTVAAEGPTVTKRWENVSIETASAIPPTIPAVLTSTGQESRIPLFRMIETAGLWRCGFMRQSNSTHYDDGTPLPPGSALYEGSALMSPRVTLTVQWPDGNPTARIVALTVAYAVAGGQAVWGR
jgi:hypothetical protein